jgi:hypothetical protein
MIDVLYVNHAHSEICGVHDLGRRHARLIARSDDVDLDYVEVDDIAHYHRVMESRAFDAVIVNYMPGIMPWVTEAIKRHRATRIAVIHNYQHDTIDRVAAHHHRLFDFVLALDPGMHPTNPWVLTTDRPLPDTVGLDSLPDRPRIGSFGFAFPHKNFPAVAAEIAATFDTATFDLHMPEAFFNGNGGRARYASEILRQIHDIFDGHPGLHVHHTVGHLTPDQVVRRLAGNTVNCLFYVPGQHNAGLSSALDYLIAARRPILVTDCAMFEHYRAGLAHFPATTLRDVIDDHDIWSELVSAVYAESADNVTEQTADHLRRVA